MLDLEAFHMIGLRVESMRDLKAEGTVGSGIVRNLGQIAVLMDLEAGSTLIAEQKLGWKLKSWNGLERCHRVGFAPEKSLFLAET
jgi:hypothetical protein